MDEKNFYVFPTKSGNSVTFELSETLQEPPPGTPPPKVKLVRNSGRCLFAFTIKDLNEPPLGVQFSSDPLWFCEGSACPTKSGIDTDQIIDVDNPNPTQLTFVNKNKGRERSLYYRLNFVIGTQPYDLDPEIKNGGGTGNLYAYAAGGLALLAVGYVAFEALSNN